MAQTILLKRRTADATAPVANDLTTGEIAVNAYSGKLYVKKTDGSVAEISGQSSDVGLIPSATFKRFEYTATNGQTTFSGNDNGSQSLSYVTGNILVYLNGVLLDDTVDYVATNGSSLVLQDGATTSDLLTVISYNKNIGTGNTTIDTFSGNGSTTAFTLSEDPENENNTSVFIDGIYQSKANYAVSGTTLTFSTAPPSGTGIEVEIGNREVATSGITEMTITGDLTVDTNTLKVDSSNNRVGIGTTSPSTALQVAGTVTATAFAGALTGNVTGNVSGTAGSATGNAATATALQNARTIGGTSFDGTANISVGLADTATALATARTIHGVSFDGTANIDLTEVVQDTAGGMFSSNTETGITATYQDGDGTVDLVIDAAQTGITSLLATDIKIGEDDQTKIDFETADEIHFYAANAEQVYVADGIFGPQTDSDVDLGSSGVRFKDAYVDTLTTTGAVTIGGNLTVNGTTTTVNSTVTTVDDPIFTIGGDSAPGSDDNKDRGVEFRWHNGSAAKVGFFGYDDSASAFTFVPDATNSSEVFSGTVGNAIFGNITGTLQTAAQTNITSLGTLTALTGGTGDFNWDSNTLVVDSSTNRVGIGNASPDVSLDIGSLTDAMHVPVGTTAQRPGSPAAGYFRYNTTTAGFEGYTTEWGAIAGGGGGGGDTISTDNFTGNGSNAAFTISQTVSSEDNLIVFEEGIYQNKADYTLSGTTLTLDEAPANGRKLTVFSIKGAVSGSNLNQDTFTGNGSTAAYTLSITPVNENNTQVFLDGVYQNKSTYSTSGTTLTFDTNVPNGTIIEVMTFNQTDINVPVDDTITTAKIVDDAVTAAKLASNAVVTASIVDDNVTSAKIADDAVGNDQLASGLTLGGNTTATLATAAQPNITSLGTLTALQVDNLNLNGNTISSTDTNGNIIITANGTGNVNVNADVLAIQGTEGETASLALQCDESDDAGDEWRFTTNTNQTLSIQNNISGSGVDHITITPHATVASSTVTIPGKVGIGIASPARSPLHVHQTTDNADSNIHLTSNETGSGSSDGFTLAVSPGGGGDGSVALIQRENAPMMFYTNSQEKMRLDYTGFLGINDADPPRRLSIIGEDGAYSGQTSGNSRTHLLLENNGGNYIEFLNPKASSAGLFFSNQDSQNNGAIYYEDDHMYLQANAQGSQLILDSTNGYVHLNGSADVRLTIGTQGTAGNNDSNWIRGSGTNLIYNCASATHRWEIGGTEAMRILTAGHLVIGRTTDSSSSPGFMALKQGGVYSSVNSSIYNTYHYYDTANGAYKFYVNGSGQVSSTSTSIALISDGRLKENVRDYTVGLNDILKLKPRVFDWKEKEGKGTKNDVGFIAQEFEEVFPDWVGGWLHDDLEDAKSVSASEIIYPMVNAIKELKAEIDALKAKVGS